MNLTPQCIFYTLKKKKCNANTIDTIQNKAKKKKKKILLKWCPAILDRVKIINYQI